jgi:HSP20 family molecular chaperone IbpA
MAKQHTDESRTIQIKRPGTIADKLAEVHDAISKRAFELFENGNGRLAGPLSDWFTAERELLWTPPIELRQKDGVYELEAAVPGVDPKNLDVQVTKDDVPIEGRLEHRHESNDGALQVSEFSSGRLFRSVHLPEAIDPGSVKAELKNGMLRVTAAIVRTPGSTIDVQAA